MKENCRICDIIKGEKGKYGLLDIPFFENDKFTSLVSVGDFVEGWTLIFSKEHQYNLHGYYGDGSFYDYLNEHISIVRKKLKWDKNIIVFEHGANKCDSLTSCGTSHAHLHIVTFEGSILDKIRSKKQWKKCKWKNVKDAVGLEEYLLYSEQPELGEEAEVFINIIEEPESQFFRKVLAEEIKLNGEYSYKKEPRIEQSMRIRKMFEE